MIISFVTTKGVLVWGMDANYSYNHFHNTNPNTPHLHENEFGFKLIMVHVDLTQVELMGGHLTVSSKEHCGSTFTFVLPHKVSHPCDSSDGTDEFEDMADNESSDDDISCGYFQFQPHTLGSLFTSNGSGITHKVNTKEINLIDDELSCIDTSSEPESSSKCNSENENTNCIKKEKENSDYLPVASCSPSEEHSSRNIQEIPKSEKKPKILLVEDHVVNVMVARRMMRQLNQDMDVVNNGAEAVRAVHRCNYDFVLMVISSSQ